MKKIIFLWLNVFLIFLPCSPVSKPLQHGLAVCDAQKNQWGNACSRMMNLLACDYDDPQILYDAGVAAYRTGQFEQARAYFQDCCSSTLATNDLKERAFFNKGNTDVEQKKLQDALDAYEQALQLNPDNQAARHNRDKVKEMLEQQKKQQQENDQKKDNDQNQQSQENNNDKNQNNTDQKNSKNSNDKEHAEKNDNEEQQESNQKKDNQEKNQSDQKNNRNNKQTSEQENQKNNEQQSDQSQDHNNEQKSSDKQDSNAGDKKDDELSERGDSRNSAGDQQTPQEKSDAAQERKSEQGNQEEKSAQRHALDKGQEITQNNERAQIAAQEKNDDLFDKHQAWMAQLLQEQENADKETNKKLVKATMANGMVNNNGNNSW